jgi:dihydroneopterin aldolase
MDRMCLTGIRGYGYTGALPEEQVLGQWFEVDVRLWLDFSVAGQSDRLADALDYRGILAIVQHLITTSRFALLERLATAIAEAILESPHPPSVVPIHQVQITLTKLAAPIPNFSGKITVEVTKKIETPSGYSQ